MANPYISRGPVRSAELFWGRIHELNEIAAFLNGNQSVSIVGPRKIGKTSLLFHLMRETTWVSIGITDENLFVYLDCEVLGEGTHSEIFGQFAMEMGMALEDRGLPPEPTVAKATEKPTRLSFETAVRKLNRRGLRIILILDEFERLSLNPNLNINFFNALRSVAGRYQLVFLTASARPLIQLTYSGKSQEILSSPFFNIFAQLFLGLMPRDEAMTLITEPARGVERPFTPETIFTLHKFLGGHPFALQVGCFHTFEKPNDFIRAKERTVRELKAHFEYYWRNLSSLEQDALRGLEEINAQSVEKTTVTGVLRDLRQKCLLKLENGHYRYTSQAWADFVANQEEQPAPNHFVSGLFTGTTITPYIIGELLGQGGMSKVYKGQHTRLKREVAIKVLPVEFANEQDFRSRFEREAQAVASLRHANIVQVYDFGDFDGTYYMVMEYIDGQDLMAHLMEHKMLTIAQAFPIMKDVAAALDFAHERGIVHRDVKPSNIMLQKGKNGVMPHRTYLTDFGIAKIRSSSTISSRTGGMLGTLNYMSPEQIQGTATVNHRTDIYALGVVLFRMLTGLLPFESSSPGAILMAHLHQPVPDPCRINRDIPIAVGKAIQIALAKDPVERFQTAGELTAVLQHHSSKST
ncbi:MAG: protein kinase [Chloroflexi bacterium]|nr:protein kinase [Chloroflexota bacterium]